MKTTSMFFEIEDDLNFSENGRQPQTKKMQPKTIKSKINNIFENGRQPQFILKKGDNLNIFLKMEDDLK